MRRIAIAATVLAALLIGLLVVRVREQRALELGAAGGSGEIEGIDVALSSRDSARVEQWHVQKGAKVHKGDLLLTLDCSDPQAALEESEARLLAARAQVVAAGASTEASRRRREAAVASELAARAQAEALAAQRDAARRQAHRIRSARPGRDRGEPRSDARDRR